MADAVILPVDVAVERTGLDAETLRRTWGVQDLNRILAEGRAGTVAVTRTARSRSRFRQEY